MIQTGMQNPVLRTPAKAITKFDAELKKLEKELLSFMKKKNGVGIAAPQIGESVRMVICKFDQKKATTLCNPEITWFSDDHEMGEEGCLSLPGVWAKVERSKEVILKYQDIKGTPIQIKIDSFAARVAQHEIDHLNGTLFFDHVTGSFEYDEGVDLEALGIKRGGEKLLVM